MAAEDVAYPIDLSPRPWSVYRGDASPYPIVDGTDPNGTGYPTDFTDLTALGTTWTSQAKRGDGLPVDVSVDASDAASGRLVLTIAGADSAGMSKRPYDDGQ